MTWMLLGLALFLGLHLIPSAGEVRAKLADQLGRNGLRGVISLGSIIGLALIIFGYGLARPDSMPIWEPPSWLNHLSALLMWLSLVMFVATYSRGYIAKLGHPMVASVKIWAFSHLLVNGRLVDLILFGAFLVWAVWVRISLKRRRPVEQRGLRPTSTAIINDGLAIVIASVIYGAIVLDLHVRFIGVSPLGL